MNTKLREPAREYAKLLVELHRLIRAGKDEDDEGDALRDRMDRPWYAMTPEERALVDLLSVDLYRIGHRWKPCGAASARDAVLREVDTCRAKHDWLGLAELVRRSESNMEPAIAQLSRAIAWTWLGLPGAAYEFFEDIMRIAPDWPPALLFFQQALLQNGEHDAAARAIEDFDSDTPRGRAFAAFCEGQLLLANVIGSELKSKKALRKAERLLLAAVSYLEDLSHSFPEDVRGDIYRLCAMACCYLAAASQLRSNLAEAAIRYRKALNFDSTNPFAAYQLQAIVSGEGRLSRLEVRKLVSLATGQRNFATSLAG